MTDLGFRHVNDLHAVRSALVVDVLRRHDIFLRDENPAIRLRVHGESMLPTLWPGDTVEIAACSSNQLRAGNILLAVRDDRLFLHRLVTHNFSSGFVLCGDSMPAPDALFPPEALLGRMISREGRPIPTSVFRARLTAKLARAAGLVLCQWSLARKVALGIHRRCNPSRQPMQAFQSTTEPSTP
jgi:Peptidase S24-like